MLADSVAYTSQGIDPGFQSARRPGAIHFIKFPDEHALDTWSSQ
jgi:hypothetical protein